MSIKSQIRVSTMRDSLMVERCFLRLLLVGGFACLSAAWTVVELELVMLMSSSSLLMIKLENMSRKV